jgi:hypothetical protein
MAGLDITEKFVDAALAKLRRHDMMRLPHPKMPNEMRDPTIDSTNDWIGWKAVPSTVNDADLDELEGEIQMRFPPSYRRFLKTAHFLALSEVGIRFVEHPIHTWSDILRSQYRDWGQGLFSLGLIPFGYESMMDAGPACFDTRTRSVNGECRVVFWDLEWKGTDQEINPLFSSSEKMFECLLFAELTDVNFIYHDDNDDPTLLSRKRDLMSQFLALDPYGAGGPARRYWTTWGVSADVN